MKGTIAGEPIPVEAALFAEHPESLGSDGLIFVVLSDLPDACETYRGYLDQAATLQSPEELADLWSTTFPPSFWEVLVVVRVADTDATIALQTLPGLAWYELLELPGRYFARFSHHVAHRDAAWFDGTGDAADYVEEYLSHQGELEVKHHVPGLRFHGQVDTLVMETDAVEPQGVVQLRFDATPCAGIIGL